MEPMNPRDEELKKQEMELARLYGQLAALDAVSKGEELKEDAPMSAQMQQLLDAPLPQPRQPMQEPMQEPMAQPMQEPMPMDMMGLQSEDIQEATSKLVAMGMLDEVAASMTPQLIVSLQEVADKIDPGLYDLNQPEQLEEFINGINNGTIDITQRPSEPTGAGVPVLGPAGGAALGPAGGLPTGVGAPAPIPGLPPR